MTNNRKIRTAYIQESRWPNYILQINISQHDWALDKSPSDPARNTHINTHAQVSGWY